MRSLTDPLNRKECKFIAENTEPKLQLDFWQIIAKVQAWPNCVPAFEFVNYNSLAKINLAFRNSRHRWLCLAFYILGAAARWLCHALQMQTIETLDIIQIR
jgi:hypothetical protein